MNTKPLYVFSLTLLLASVTPVDAQKPVPGCREVYQGIPPWTNGSGFQYSSWERVGRSMRTSFRYKYGGRRFIVVYVIKGPDGREYFAQKAVRDDTFLTFVFPADFSADSPLKPGRYTWRAIVDCFEQAELPYGGNTPFIYDPAAATSPTVQRAPEGPASAAGSNAGASPNLPLPPVLQLPPPVSSQLPSPLSPQQAASAMPRIFRIGGDVSAPQLIHKVEPNYSPQARQARYQGTVALNTVINEQGIPTDITVIRPLGLGLDEEAIRAVKQWRFKPALRLGQPVSVYSTIDVAFRLTSPPAQGAIPQEPCIPKGGSGSGIFNQFTGSNSLYPLQPGIRWVYRVSSAASGSSRVTMTNLNRREIMGRTVTPQSSDSGTISFMLEDRTGIYEVARQGPGDMGPVSKTAGFVVKYPIQVCASYTTRSELVLFAALSAAFGGSGRAPELTVTAVIEGVDEIVTVPAGTFGRCVKVKEVGRVRLQGVNYYVEHHTWLAPGVGAVRSIVREWKDAPDVLSLEKVMGMDRLELTMDLESFTNDAR